jgi:hypothetical protein
MATLSAGQTRQFTATVTGASNTAVTWSLSSAAGTISAAGLYTAPPSLSQQQSVTVTATSVADPGRSTSATVSLTPPPPVAVSISPATATLSAGQTRQFTATVTGASNAAVTWSLSSAAGTISATGLYTAPPSVSQQQAVTVTATSVADASRSASATVNLTPSAAIAVNVSPSAATLGAGQTRQFTATVTGANNTAVTGSLNSSIGKVSAAGVYTAPVSVTKQQAVQVTATSIADPRRSAVATVQLVPAAQTQLFTVSWARTSATQVRVDWTAPSGRPAQDYIVLTSYGSADWWYVWDKSTGGAPSGSYTVDIPANTGLWEFRYYLASGKQPAARSSLLPVNVGQFSVSGTPVSVSSSGKITVSFTAPTGRPTGWDDLVGLYKVGAPNDTKVWYEYTRGATRGSFTLPAPGPGVYEFRYVLVDDPVAALSAPITVQ